MDCRVSAEWFNYLGHRQKRHTDYAEEITGENWTPLQPPHLPQNLRCPIEEGRCRHYDDTRPWQMGERPDGRALYPELWFQRCNEVLQGAAGVTQRVNPGGYLLVRLLLLFAALPLTEVATETLLFLNGFPAACIEPPVIEPKLDISFLAFAPHLGHLAGLSDSLIDRINSNCLPHLGQRYSYTAICNTSFTSTQSQRVC